MASPILGFPKEKALKAPLLFFPSRNEGELFATII
jgi:hypothetical protein